MRPSLINGYSFKDWYYKPMEESGVNSGIKPQDPSEEIETLKRKIIELIETQTKSDNQISTLNAFMGGFIITRIIANFINGCAQIEYNDIECNARPKLIMVQNNYKDRTMKSHIYTVQDMNYEAGHFFIYGRTYNNEYLVGEVSLELLVIV